MTITAPYYDSELDYAPSFAAPESITAPFLDTLAEYAPTISEVDVPVVELLVNGTPLDVAFARSFDEQIADTGSFSFQVLREDFAGIDFDDLITFKVHGTARFLGVVEQIVHTAYAQGEEADQVVTVSGRGSLALFDQHVVYPSRGVGELPIEEVRSFSWVAPDFSSTDWPFAKKVNQQRSYAFFEGVFIGAAGPVPHIWPDTSGWWIWANRSDVSGLNAPQGTCLFRKSFSLATDRRVRVFSAFDNSGRLYLDGAEVADFSGFTVGEYVDIDLSAGSHLLAASVTNAGADGDYNPGGLLVAVYTVHDSGLLDDLVVNTDATWRCLPYPSTVPGFTHGEVIRILVEEAGLDATWDLDFTDNRDTDGQAWGEHREITVGVGRTLLEVLREMSDIYLDVSAAPGSMKLRAWRRGGRGVTRSAVLQQTTDPATSDFLSWQHTGKRTRMNSALIRYAGGHTEYEATSSISTYGTRGVYLELGAVRSSTQAVKVASELAQNRADPAYASTGVLHPRSDSSTPYKAFRVGDTITAPDETDATVSMRVLSIGLQEDEDGVIDWPVSLRDMQLELEERHNIWLRRMADGAVLGGARVSSRAGTPAPSATRIAQLRVAEFSYDNSALTVSTSPRRPAEVSGNIVEVFGELTTAGSSTTTVVVYLNGVALTTLTFPSGTTEVDVPVSIEPVRANVDKLQVSITAAGTGAEGLDVQVRAI